LAIELNDMEVEYAKDDLDSLANDAEIDGGFAQAVVKAYRKRVQFIKGATDERDFYAMRSLHFEKLKGSRAHQRSMRLNDQWRLILEIVPGDPKNIVRIVEIKDYHR